MLLSICFDYEVPLITSCVILSAGLLAIALQERKRLPSPSEPASGLRIAIPFLFVALRTPLHRTLLNLLQIRFQFPRFANLVGFFLRWSALHPGIVQHLLKMLDLRLRSVIWS